MSFWSSRTHYERDELQKDRQLLRSSSTSCGTMARTQNPNIEILLDVMPTDEKILGFSNDWYAGAIDTARKLLLPSGASIRLIDAAHFLATKLAAFDQRGEEDHVMSSDLEDVICVLDGRPELEDEIERAEADVRSYVCGRLRDLLKDTQFLEALSGHLPGDPGSQARLPDLVARLERLAATLTD